MKRPEMCQALKVRKQTQLRPAHRAGRNRKDLAGNRSSLVFLDADVLDLDIGRLIRPIRGPYRTEAQPGACRDLPLDSGLARTSATDSAIFELVNMVCVRCAVKDLP
jgi:hypothetical protein